MRFRRRAAAGFAAFLMAVSLVSLPAVGRAHFIDGPLNNPPPREGEPDEPGYMIHEPLLGKLRLWMGRIAIVSNGSFLVIFVLPNAARGR